MTLTFWFGLVVWLLLCVFAAICEGPFNTNVIHSFVIKIFLEHFMV